MLWGQGALSRDHLVALGKPEKDDVLVHVGNTIANVSHRRKRDPKN